MDKALCRSIYFYDGKDLRYRIRRSNQVAGKIVGTIGQDGYRKCAHMGKQYKVHRLIWLLVYGEWPKNFIDHINGVRDDNRLDNLRDVSHSVNVLNQQPRGKCPYVGVNKQGRTGRFEASLQVSGKRRYLGTFDTQDDALAARTAAEIKYLGEQYSNLRQSGGTE